MTEPIQFAALGPSSTATGSDRRFWERFPCQLEVSWPSSTDEEPRAARKPWLASACDASVGGLGLVLDEPLAPGSEFVVDLRDPVDGLTQALRLRVVHVSPLPGGQWRAGCVVLD